MRTNATATQYALVVDHIGLNGSNCDLLTAEEQYEIFAEGDGLGYLPAEELRQINSGYDWSHVRDSSDEGVLRMHAKLAEILFRKIAAEIREIESRA